MDVAIATDSLGLVITTTGGGVWRFFAKTDRGERPLFREPPAGEDRAALKSGCFPLVPFGNRVRGNHFRYDGRDILLTANMPWDRHYLHGDGWTSEWTLAAHDGAAIRLVLDYRDPDHPYRYDAEQRFALDGDTLMLTLSVTNRGDVALPFGLGWHPYFPLTPDTRLTTAARSYWDEDETWLPTVEHPVGGDLDFSAGASLPRRWVNTAFEGWDGRAAIAWPDRDARLEIAADPLFDRSLIFVSDPAFDPGYAYDFFCFEPMSHSVDAHNRANGGLRRLEPGQTLAGSVRFTFSSATEPRGRQA